LDIVVRTEHAAKLNDRGGCYDPISDVLSPNFGCKVPAPLRTEAR
jgi:hypothetical protein